MLHRPTLYVVAAAVLAAAVSLVWVEVRQEREFRRLIAVGDAALAQGQMFVANEAFSGAVVLKPDSMVAYLKRGDTYLRRGELAAALRDLREAAALAPAALQPIELLGDVNRAMGRHDRAAEYYRQYLEIDDRTARVFYKLGLALVVGGRPASAIEPLMDGLALDEGLAEAHYLLGVALLAGNRSADAARALRRAVAIHPQFVAAREELAALYESLGRRREAIEELEAVAAIEPALERQVQVGLAYARLGRVEPAVEALARAARRAPEHPLVYQALGRVWLDAAGNADDASALPKALEALERIADRPDASSETLTLYGRALLMSQQVRAAEQVLQRAASRMPLDPDALRHLADAAERLGHRAIADDARARLAALAE